MKSLQKISTFILIASAITACSFNGKNKDMDPFYTRKNYQDYPIVPLSKPIFMYYDKSYDEWFFKIPDSFKNKLNIEKLNEIGVDGTNIYGQIPSKERNVSDYKEGDYIYMYVDGAITWTKDKRIVNDTMVQVTSFDSITKNFIEPERWFIINTADLTTAAFFSKSKYKNYLTDKGISGKKYNIEKYHKQFLETGILPWFPDSIQVKLKE